MSNRATEKLTGSATGVDIAVTCPNQKGSRMRIGQVHQRAKQISVATSLPLLALAISLAAAFTTAVIFWPGVGIAGHVEGKETNVVIMVCAIDDHSPYRIHVRSLSINTTQAKMPLVSTKTSCAQALHEFLTEGFEIVDSNLENYFKFVLTRVDKCRKRN